jgi:YVTN family beta-propeller protein
VVRQLSRRLARSARGNARPQKQGTEAGAVGNERVSPRAGNDFSPRPSSSTVIDAETMKVIATIPVGEFPHGLRPSPDGKWVYVANANGTTLGVIDTATNTKVADIEVGQRPVQVGFSPDGKFDVATRVLVGKVPVGVGPIQVFVTPDNKYVLAANVAVLDIDAKKVIATIPSGAGPNGISFSMRAPAPASAATMELMMPAMEGMPGMGP